MKMTAFWDIAPCSLVEVVWRFVALMMEAVRISEIPVCFETTGRYIPESCHLQFYISSPSLDLVSIVTNNEERSYEEETN
jgi:hypothetical protein